MADERYRNRGMLLAGRQGLALNLIVVTKRGAVWRHGHRDARRLDTGNGTDSGEYLIPERGPGGCGFEARTSERYQHGQDSLRRSRESGIDTGESGEAPDKKAGANE